jgi:hypothetical protein
MALERLPESAAAAVLFAATFLFGGRLHPLRAWVADRRVLISFAGGMTAAYVFVHVMPELHGTRRALVESMSQATRYEGMAIYFVALVGFLAFYGLERLRDRAEEAEAMNAARRAYAIHLGGFAVYAAMMAYLLVHGLEDSASSVALYALAIAFHFLAVDHSLTEEYGAVYRRTGRPLLAAACLLGWGAGVAIALPHAVLALLVAFVSGGIIMNSLIIELSPRDGNRFGAFMTGGLLYGLILVPLGSS